MKNNQKRAIFILFSCQTAQNIIEVGKRLIQAKSLVNHGEWQHWLELNFQLSHSTAKNFMACAERFGESQSIGFLKSTQMIQLLALPDAAETEKFIAEKAAEGQEIGKLVLLAEARLGELFNQMPKAHAGGWEKKENLEIPSAGKSEIDESESDEDDEEEEPPKPKLEVAAQMGFNKNQVAQFQKLADNPDAVQKAIDDAKDNDEIVTRSKALEIIKANDATSEEKKIPIQQNTGNNERYTPKEYIDAAREVLGTIDLDPASSELANETVKATKFFTAQDDGLAQEWFGNIWLNPPYAKDLLPKFAEKFARDKSRCDKFTYHLSCDK